MTRKHYRALAQAIYMATQPKSADPTLFEQKALEQTKHRVIGAIATALAGKCPRFNRHKFIEACLTGRM